MAKETPRANKALKDALFQELKETLALPGVKFSRPTFDGAWKKAVNDGAWKRIKN